MGVLYGEFMDTDESQTEIEPQREGIIAEYIEDGLGYLIQQANGGYRYLQVESGEEDEVGDLVGTRRAAIALAVSDWRKHQGDDWADWSRQMAADAVAPDRVDVEELAEFIESNAHKLTKEQARSLSAKIADYLN